MRVLPRNPLAGDSPFRSVREHFTANLVFNFKKRWPVYTSLARSRHYEMILIYRKLKPAAIHEPDL